MEGLWPEIEKGVGTGLQYCEDIGVCELPFLTEPTVVSNSGQFVSQQSVLNMSLTNQPSITSTQGVGTLSSPFLPNASGTLNWQNAGYYELTNEQANGGNPAGIYYVSNEAFIQNYNSALPQKVVVQLQNSSLPYVPGNPPLNISIYDPNGNAISTIQWTQQSTGNGILISNIPSNETWSVDGGTEPPRVAWEGFTGDIAAPPGTLLGYTVQNGVNSSTPFVSLPVYAG